MYNTALVAHNWRDLWNVYIVGCESATIQCAEMALLVFILSVCAVSSFALMYNQRL
jgi:hypothetical protein